MGTKECNKVNVEGMITPDVGEVNTYFTLQVLRPLDHPLYCLYSIIGRDLPRLRLTHKICSSSLQCPEFLLDVLL